MRKSVRDLLALQTVDMRIRNLEIRRSTIPVERAKIVGEFEVVKKALAAAAAAVKEVEKNIRICQSENASEQEKLKAGKIRSATVRKAAEFDALNAEIAGCEKRISELETKELELYDELEKVKAAAVKAERTYKATGRLAQGEVRELDALKEKVAQEIQAKKAESAMLEKNVPQSVLAQYKRILASGKGEPLTPIGEGGFCGNCSLKLPPMTLNEATKGNMIPCDHCSYFIYDPNAKDS